MLKKALLLCFLAVISASVWAQTAAKPALQLKSYEPTMVTIPAGKFLMGEQSDQSGKDEVPVHAVDIKSFRLAKTEITVGQYRQFVLESGYLGGDKCSGYNASLEWKEQPGNWMSPKNALSDNHPVACIGWYDAQAYVKWLVQKTGKQYRLPTEAEWEYAARAGSSTQYTYGNDPSQICSYGNVGDRAGKATYSFSTIANCNDGGDFTVPVGSYKPNKFGLYDVIGNAWEWTEDCYHLTYDGAPVNGSAWIAGECKSRVLRGGSWGGGPVWARSAARTADDPMSRDISGGFRVAQDI